MEDYIKCELIGRGSPRHLNTFLTCILLLNTTHIPTRAMYCCYCDCTHVHHVVHYKTIRKRLYLVAIACLYPCRVSRSLLRGHGNIVQENITADIFGRGQFLWTC